MSYLNIIKLKNDNVHIRHSTSNLNFYPKRFDGRNIGVTLWVLTNGTDYAVFNTEKMIQQIRKSSRENKECVVISKTKHGYSAVDIDIRDCILQSQKDGHIVSNQKIDGLDRVIEIARKYSTQKDLYEKSGAFTKPFENKSDRTKIYQFKDMVYSGIQSTENSVDKDYLRQKQKEDAAEAEIETTAETQSTDDSVDEEYLSRKEQEDAAEAEIDASDISDTEKERQILARDGHGRFRNAVLKRYGYRCVLTDIETALIASHIMPWADCKTAEQRLSPDNGLLLAATYDRLFDQGYISFDENGELLVSDDLLAADREKLFRDNDVRRKLPNPSTKTLQYLQYHRAKHHDKQLKPLGTA